MPERGASRWSSSIQRTALVSMGLPSKACCLQLAPCYASISSLMHCWASNFDTPNAAARGAGSSGQLPNPNGLTASLLRLQTACPTPANPKFWSRQGLRGEPCTTAARQQLKALAACAVRRRLPAAEPEVADAAGSKPAAAMGQAAPPASTQFRRRGNRMQAARGRRCSLQQHTQQPHDQPQPRPQPQPQQCDSLHGAAAAGDAAAVRRLLAGPTAARQLDQPGPDGCTPLHVAANSGHLDAAELLLLAGADANAGDAATGAAPLHSAAAAGDAHMVQLLLNHGADAAACDRQGRTACHRAAACCSAGSANGTLLRLARHAPRLLGQQALSGSGDTPLLVLCRLPEGRCLPSLQDLASCGLLTDAALNTADAAGQTPLACAAAAGSVAVVELLLCCGARPSPSSPCRHARGCGRAQRNTAQGGLLQAADLCVCPLGAAAASGQYGCLLALLRAGAGAGQLSSIVLQRACQLGRADVAAALLRAGLQVRNTEAHQLLLVAVERGDEALLDALLGNGEGCLLPIDCMQ